MTSSIAVANVRQLSRSTANCCLPLLVSAPLIDLEDVARRP